MRSDRTSRLQPSSATDEAGPATPSTRVRRPLPARFARALAWTLFGLLALVVLVVAGGYLLIQTDWFRERARLLALERLRSAVQGRVEVARLRGDLLRGVTLEGISVTGPAGEPFLSVERMDVDYELGGFLQQKVLLGDVTLVEPRITLVEDAQGSWNYLRILPFLRGREKPQEPGGWGSVVRVEKLVLRDGALGVATEREARAFGPLGAAPELTDLNGTLHLDISTEGEGRKRVAAEDLSFFLQEQQIAVRELDARGTFTPAGLAVERFLLRTAETELSGAGMIRSLAEPVFDLRFDADPLALEELRHFYPGVPFEGTVRGRVGLAGPGADLELTLKDFVLETPGSRVTGEGLVTTEEGPVLDARLALDPLAPADARVLWRGYPLEEPLRGDLTLRGTSSRLGVRGDLAYGGTSGSVSGTLSFGGREPAYDLRIAARQLDLEDVFHAPAWSSVINGEFLLAGRGLGTGAAASFSGTVRDSRILFYDLVAGSFAGRFRPGAFEADTFHVVLPRSEIWGRGIMPYDYTLRMDLRAVSRNLQDFFPGLGPAPAARFEGQGTLEGPYAGLDLTLTGTADSLAWKQLVADSFAGRAVFEDLGGPGFRMALDGTASSVDYIGPIAFETAEFHAGFAEDTMGVTLAVRMDSLRTAEGHLDVDFSGASPRIVLDRGAMTLRTGRWVVEEPSGFVYRDGVFQFDDFALTHDGQRVAVDGTLSLDGPQDFRFALEQVSLDDLQALAGIQAGVTGVFDGTGVVSGTDLAPEIQSEFTLAEGRVGDVAVKSLEGRVDYADRELSLDVALAPETAHADSLEDPGTLLIRGTFPVDLAFEGREQRIPDRPLDLRVESRGVTLAILQTFFPRITETRGKVEFAIHLQGRPSEPRYDGEIAVRDGALRVGDGPLYTGISGSARFDNDQVSFRDVKVSSATGDARLTGRIAIRELTLGDIEAKLEARRFTLIDEDGKELIVDVDIELSGTTREPVVTGRLNVEQMEWPLPARTEKDVIDLDEAIIYVRAEGDTAAPEPAPDVWRQTRLDLAVNVEDDAILKSDQALIVLQGGLSIEKARGRDVPVIAGELEVVRGFYSDFGTQFEITEGEVFFYGTPELDPGLHLLATETVENQVTGQEVELTLTVGGTVQHPTLNVTSVPEFEKSEIFSLMLFGTPAPGPGQQERFESTVTRVASRQAALPLQRALVSELNLDLLEIQPGVGAEGTRFRFGKYIQPDVFLTYTQGIGPREESLFGIQYRISRKWTVETQAGTRQFGADIFYEFQY